MNLHDTVSRLYPDHLLRELNIYVKKLHIDREESIGGGWAQDKRGQTYERLYQELETSRFEYRLDEN